jgi:hypothetical protein
MKMFDATILLFAALALAVAVHFSWPSAREFMPVRRAWLGIALGAVAFTAASWFVAEEGRGGTSLQLRHGWPKFTVQNACRRSAPGREVLIRFSSWATASFTGLR